MRWFTPPPCLTAYFSSSRSPGVVFLVSTIPTPRSLTLATILAVIVAIPLILCKKFKATLSPHKIGLAGPSTSAISSPATTLEPSL